MIRESPFFSVILPTYNRAEFLPKALASVISQTFTDWELVIIDDASTDDTRQVVKQYSDSRIKYLKNETNIERSASRNRGIKESKGQYICFLDSDDYYMDNHLAEFYKIIEANSFSKAFFCCNPYEKVDEKLIELPNNPLGTRNKVENVLINIIAIPCVCIHRKILSEHQFNQAYTIGEDLDLWVRIVKKYKLIHNNIYTVVFVSHEGRTVHLKNKTSFIDHINLIKHIIHEDKDKWISKEVRKIALSNAYYNLARHYEFVGGKSKAVFYLIYSLIIYPFYYWKKKLFMILNNCILTHWLIKLRKR